jgi:hypothetical protein
MAIGQTVCAPRILPEQQSNHSPTLIYPFEGLAEAYLINDGKRRASRSPHRRQVKPTSRTNSDMTKATTSSSPMATPRATAVNKNAIASGSRIVTSPTRPTETTNSTFQHRRKSSQSLTLDLEGLDLGQGVRSAGGLEQLQQQPREEVHWNRKNDPRSRNRFRANTAAAPKMPEEPSKEPGQHHVEDSFFAHLRKCEDSYDILDTAQTLSMPAASSSDELGTQTATQQVLGGFASLGYNSNTAQQANANDGDSEASPYSSVPVSPYLGGRKNRKLPWRTLVPIMHDPMNTLDILSVEEMGLHSIDVGSSKEWEGFSLSYQSGSSKQSEDEQSIRPAQWVVAKSNKKQRKWIVAPESLSASRTVIVSGHIGCEQRPKREVDSPHSDTAPVFVCSASFDLRFLRPDRGSTGLTTTLTNPAAHRATATRNGLESSISTTQNETGSLLSLGIFEEQEASAAASHHNATANAIAKEAVADAKALIESPSRPPLVQSKSSSTIHATVPMIQLTSRRPSLGKSVSHESLSFHSPSLDASRRLSRTSMATVTMNDSATIKGNRHSGTSATYKPATVVNEELAFADYSIGVKTLHMDSSSDTTDSPSSASPTSTPHGKSNLSSLRQPKIPIPVLSTIDSERMAEYHRRSSERFTPANRFQDVGWQGGAINHRPSARKDRRLSEWFKKKVMPAPPAVTPLPAAWEQQRDIHSVATATNIRSTAKAMKSGRPVKSYSNVSKSSGSSSQLTSGDSYQATVGSPYSLSQASLLSTSQQSDAEEKEQGSRPINMAAAAAHGHNVWPGVLSQRNERRRSNSDDHLLTMGEAAKRRIDSNGSKGSPIVATDWQDEDDSLNKLSLSMPTESVMSAFGDLSLEEVSPSKTTPIELLDLESVPNKSMTMVIPLPVGKRSDQSASRYIRISYVPFGADQAAGSSEDSDRESCDEGPGASQASQPAWYKRFTHALSAGTRSSSPGSNEDSEASDDVSNDSKGVAESFRIIAKVLEAPNRKKSTFKDYSLPPATPFPVILGWCDQQRSVKLVPEGWQAIGLANGPAEVGSPLCGLADLIMAGTAASMEL